MKKLGLIIIFLVFSFLVVLPGHAYAAEGEENPGNGEYAIIGYVIDIKVNEDNTFNITETITARFDVPKLGIYRKIPLTNEVTRLDGTRSANRARVTDITGTDIYKVYSSGGYKVIELGEPDDGVRSTGIKEYTISYVYNIGRDTGKGYDEFYFNLIGPEWDTTISNVSFTITMPKEFDSSKLGFSSGPVGSTTSNVVYEVNGNVITGSLNGMLKPGEALTVRLELPDGYFTDPGLNFDLLMILAIILPVLFAVLAFLLWFRYGRDDMVVETVEFYPPEGFNSAEVGFLYKGAAETIDVVSLLIYLANRGYLRIEETVEKALFSSVKGFKIIKVREYDGNNANEKLFFDGLFKYKVLGAQALSSIKDMASLTKLNVVEKTEVTQADLRNNFYTTLNAITASLNGKENKEKIFVKSSLNKSIIVVLMIITAFVLITIKPMSDYGDIDLLLPALIFPGIGFTILFGSLVSALKMPKLFGILFGGFFGGLPWAMIVLPALLEEPVFLLTYVLGMVCVVIMLFFIKYMKKRTVYGNEMLGRIKGFKSFLLAAEKPKLEALVMDNPSYFYNILPFTYVLGVSKKWIKKFETIALQEPDWYSGTSTFSTASFGSFMNSTMTSAASSMSSSPGGSGGSSGGGSSGGGSGGGGGGSR